MHSLCTNKSLFSVNFDTFSLFYAEKNIIIRLYLSNAPPHLSLYYGGAIGGQTLTRYRVPESDDPIPIYLYLLFSNLFFYNDDV